MTDAAKHTRAEKLFLQAARRFNTTLEYEELMREVLGLVLTAARSEAALVFRVDHNRTDMKIRYITGDNCEMRVFHREVGQGVVGWVAQYREPVIINDAASDARVDTEVEQIVGIKQRSLISLPLIGKGQMIGVIVAINKIDGEFDNNDLDILMGLANQMAVAIDNAHLYRQVRKEALEKDTLYRIGKNLASSLDLKQLSKEIMEALKEVVEYSAGGIFLVEPDSDEIHPVFQVGYEEALNGVDDLKVGMGLVGNVVATGQATIASDVNTDKRYIKARASTRSEIVVPMVLGSRVIGAFTLESDQLNAYQSEHLSLLSAFASQAAISIERTRLHERMLSSQRLDQQLQVARQIQRTFLPDQFPKVPGYDLTGMNVSSEQVGGDYFDFIHIVDGQTGIVIGDVAGKGIPAALIMASFRASLLAEIRNNYSISTICQKVNNLIYESITADNFVTAVYGVLNSHAHVFTYSNCGHNLPVLLRRNGEIFYLKEGGQLLGVAPNATYREDAIHLDPGDVLVMYTDGVTEVFDDGGSEFGLEGLIAVIKSNRHRKAEEIQEAIHAAVSEHSGQKHIFDDVTMVVVKRRE